MCNDSHDLGSKAKRKRRSHQADCGKGTLFVFAKTMCLRQASLTRSHKLTLCVL